VIYNAYILSDLQATGPDRYHIRRRSSPRSK